MAIDFPNSPSNGTTYTYLGVKYTYVDSGGGLGYWKVDTVGSVGSASQPEIDAGVNNTKYITPYGLHYSKYNSTSQLSGYAKAGNTQVKDGSGNTFEVLLDGYLHNNVHTVGPTGSGADEVVTGLDSIPVGSILLFKLNVKYNITSLNPSAIDISLGKGGVTMNYNSNKFTASTSGPLALTTAYRSSTNLVVPTDTNGVFQFYWSPNGYVDLTADLDIELVLTGFISP